MQSTDVQTAEHVMVAADATTAAATNRSDRRRRTVRRNAALGGMVGAAAIFSSGCTLSDVSTILSILRLLGIGA